MPTVPTASPSNVPRTGAPALQSTRGASPDAFGAAEGKAFENLGNAVGAAADVAIRDERVTATAQDRAQAKLAQKLQNRREAVDRADFLIGYQTQRDTLVREATTQGDLSREADLTALGEGLRALRTDTLQRWPGSQEGGLVLAERIATAEGETLAAAAKTAALIGKKKLETVLDGTLGRARSVINSDPSRLDEQINDVFLLAQEDAGGFDPGEEIEQQRRITAELGDTAAQALILQGKFGEAEAVAKRPDIAAALGNERQTQLFEQIGRHKQALAEAAAEAALEPVTGANGARVSAADFAAMSDEDKRSFIGLEEDAGHIATQAEKQRIGADPNSIWFIPDEGAPKEIKAAEKSLARIEDEKRVEARGKMSGTAEGIQSILNAVGADPLPEGPVAVFEGGEESSEDMQTVARRVMVAQRLFAAGQTEAANGQLALARITLDTSSDIQTAKELNKPLSVAMLRATGLPPGASMRDARDLLGDQSLPSSIALARDKAVATKEGTESVLARQQIEFLGGAREHIESFLTALDADPGIAGFRGSLRSAGQTAKTVLEDLSPALLDSAVSLAFGTEAGPDEMFEWFGNPRLSTIDLFENSVGIMWARIQQPKNRLPVDVIKRSIASMQITGLKGTEQIRNRMDFLLNMLASRDRGLQKIANPGQEQAPAPEAAPASEAAQPALPTFRIEGGGLVKVK